MSSCWTMSPSCLSSPSGSRGTRTHNGRFARTCFRGRLLIQSDDFHSCSSCGDRNRTCVTTVNSRLPVPARTPPQCHSVSVVGFEPTLSCSRCTRISRLSHTLRRVESLGSRVEGPNEKTLASALTLNLRPSTLNRSAPSGSRTHTSALARRYAAATS